MELNVLWIDGWESPLGADQRGESSAHEYCNCQLDHDHAQARPPTVGGSGFLVAFLQHDQHLDLV